VSPLQATKAWLVDHVDLAKDALHVYVGLAVFLGVAALFGWRITGWRPWSAVAAVAIAGELWDLRDSLVYGTRPVPAANLHDVWNTLFWPTVLMVLARRTKLLSGEREQSFEQSPAVGAAVSSLDPPLRVGHHAEHVPGVVQDPGDPAR
jgi:hypothetical protein